MKLWNQLVDSLRARWKFTPRQRILMALLENATKEHVVADLMRAAHVSSGTIYPVLFALEAEKILQSRFEGDPSGERPRRRLYKFTPTGHEAAQDELLLAAS